MYKYNYMLNSYTAYTILDILLSTLASHTVYSLKVNVGVVVHLNQVSLDLSLNNQNESFTAAK
jgi:hypothetical protein